MKYIACTSDIWSKDRRSFIAINAHWIAKSGELKSALLACDRFKGSHTGIEIRNKIKGILSEYEIIRKAVAITTDNASNYKCAFERDVYEPYAEMMAAIDDDEDVLFQLDLNDLANVWCPAEELLPNDDVVGLCANALCDRENMRDALRSDLDDDDDDVNDSNANDYIRIRNLPASAISDVLDHAVAVNLPIKIDCAAHTLNLIGKVDSFDALTDDEYSSQYITVQMGPIDA